MEKIHILSGSASKTFANKIVKHLNNSVLIDVESSTFKDGEINVFINGNIRGQDVFIVQSFYTSYKKEKDKFVSDRSVNDNFMELLLLIDACKRASAKSITAVIPYFGYARQDRKIKRAPISARLVSDMLTSAGVSRVMTMDLHSDQIQGFFSVPVDNLYGSILAANHIGNVLNEDAKRNLAIVSPDVGGANRARRFKAILESNLETNINLALVEKVRVTANEIESMNVIGDIKDKTVIIIDDIVDTAGTLCKAAEILYDEGAKEIFAYCTHPVMSDSSQQEMKTVVQKIKNSKISKLFVSNTIPLRSDQSSSSKIEVISQDLIFSIAIDRIFNNKSISKIFNDPETVFKDFHNEQLKIKKSIKHF